MRPLEQLSKRQRAATPREFAMYLLRRVRSLCNASQVACLWVMERSIYHELPGCDCWPKSRNARLYDGPGPIIAHPPCGPWGKYRAVSRESTLDGELAMEMVHRFGGVVEQPLGSRLFDVHGRGGWERVSQGDYGHAADKQTILYFYGRPCVN